jgi:RNA recognition motif-containing protein
MKLFVGNLSLEIRDAELKEAFTVFGDVSSAEVVMDIASHSRGFGFVEFTNNTDARAAIQSLNGANLGGRSIVVHEALTPASERAERSRSAHGGSKRW